MADYIDIKNNIEAILESNLPIVDQEYRDLILDSIMTTLRDSGLSPYGFQSDYIYGYRIEDLVVIAERLHKDKVDPRALQNDNETYLAGYNRAYEEVNASIEKSINRIIDDIRDIRS